MNDVGTEIQLVRRALAGDTEALRPLVDALTPVIQTRVARALLRARGACKQRRDVRQELADFTQEVFLALFDDDARALRSWDITRGLSLHNFVGLVTEHQVASLLRSGRRNPWTEEPFADSDLDDAAGDGDDADARIYSRDLLAKLLDALRIELSPRGLLLFEWLVVDGRAPSDVSERMGLTLDAVYAWRSRFGKLARRLAEELEAGVRSGSRLTSSSIGRSKEEGTAP
jgi:RNA polymerase sigma-70 factor (ECF subfamily)